MSAGQKSGTGAMTDLEDEEVRKNDILSNRDKTQRPSGQSLDGKGVQVDEYKDTTSNQRSSQKHDRDGASVLPEGDQPDAADGSDQVDRPGFDLGGSTGKTRAGKGLGLGTDAKEGKKGWRLRD